MTDLWPFFTYFGGKWRAAPRYPTPTHQRIVEPFAGAAGYSVRHASHDVELYDADPVIVGVWDYLIRASASDILALPLEVETVDTLPVCQEARWLIGFWLNKGTTHPCRTPSAWMRSGVRPNSQWGEAIRARIASQVESIRHWTVTEASFTEVPTSPSATWFVDPPYERSGVRYRYHKVDYVKLGEWCRGLDGQVMVCEQEGAAWLPFRPFATTKALEGRRGSATSREVIWP